MHYARRQNKRKEERWNAKRIGPASPSDDSNEERPTAIHIYVYSVSKRLQLPTKSDYSNPQQTTVTSDLGTELQP